MIYPSRFALALSVFALAAAVPTCAHATNLVTNGNFSSGFSGWTFSETASYPWSTGGAGDYASDGCIGQPCITGTPSEQSYLYQDVSTVAGDTYTLSFEFSDVGNAMELQALFGGTIAEDLLNIGTTPLTTYTILNLTATSSLTELEFLGRQDPGYDELTDVSLTLSGDGDSAVPEPGTIGMVGTGVLGLFGVARRKRLFS